jgi:hypothetical protein
MSAHDYDRTKTAREPFPYHKPAEADEGITKVYLALHSFKFGFDQMEEIPKNFLPIYDQTMKTLSAVMKAQEETHQLRQMAKKLPTR